MPARNHSESEPLHDHRSVGNRSVGSSHRRTTPVGRHTVTVYNRTTTKARSLQTCGITVVTRPEQAIAHADCVILMVADAAAIRAVLLTPASLAVLRGKTVIQMGTIAQEESLALQAKIERVGGSYCEASVLERTIAQGFGDSDSSTLFEVVNPIP